ncbi:hypothetical protein [Pseudonocardia sp. ICBG601]|uniref:hypothetical protein n=1 Tax=Pseudonocardia sp. ICBG601 TaxID=2846759 RepID=UPI0035AB7D65
MITSDYAEPRTIILDPVKNPSPYLRRPTVRTWDISDLNKPKVKSVQYLPTGPRSNGVDPLRNENRAVMETTVTNRPEHKGAFAQTMQGGAIFYTPDITADNPEWKEVFDLGTAAPHLGVGGENGGPSANGGWIQTSADDKTLYHATIGARPARWARTTRAPRAASSRSTSRSCWPRDRTRAARSTRSPRPQPVAPRPTARHQGHRRHQLRPDRRRPALGRAGQPGAR